MFSYSKTRNKSRTAMYKWLATQMNLTREETHVKYFNINQCKQALSILKIKYKQLYGKNNISRTEKKELDRRRGK